MSNQPPSQRIEPPRGEGDTSRLMHMVVRPDFLAVLGAFLTTILGVGIAWGVQSTRITQQEDAVKAIWSKIDTKETADQQDHDAIVRMDEGLKYIKSQLHDIQSELRGVPVSDSDQGHAADRAKNAE